MTFEISYKVSSHEDSRIVTLELDVDGWGELATWCEEMEKSGFSEYYDVTEIKKVK